MTAVYADGTSFLSLLKEFYGAADIRKAVYKDNPLFAMLKKEEDWGGKVIPLPIVYGNPQGASATFASAKANQRPGKYESFLLTTVEDHSLATITNKVMLQTRNDDGAFLKALKTEMDGALLQLKNRIGASAFQSGTGSIGRVSVEAAGVITLADPDSVTQFEVDQVLVVSATDGGAADAAKGYVIAVDRDLGKVTVSATYGGLAGQPSVAWATGAAGYLSVDGDLNLRATGLQGWIPSTSPTATPFFGVVRSVDPTRLGGIRWDGTAQNVEEALIDAAARMSREGASPDTCFLSFASYANLEKHLGSRVQYVDVADEEIGISFRGIRLNTPKGEVKVFADRSCPSKKAYLLTMDTWVCGSMKEAPHVSNEDGLTSLRVADAAAIEVRLAAYYQFGCHAPGHNAVVSLSA